MQKLLLPEVSLILFSVAKETLTAIKVHSYALALRITLVFLLTNVGTLGSIVPVGGTAAGIIVGVGAAVAAYAVASMSDDYIGDYLRYIG